MQGCEANSCLIPRETQSMGDFSSPFFFFSQQKSQSVLSLFQTSTPRSGDIRGYFRKAALSPAQGWCGSLSLTQPHSSAAQQRHRGLLDARPGGEMGI